jgi:hypothetical protein
MQSLEKTATTTAVVIAVISYSLCSSTLLLANKMTIEYLPSSVVSFIQVVITTITCLLIKCFGYPVDGFDWSKLRAYTLYIFIFVSVLFTNMKALSVSNVGKFRLYYIHYYINYRDRYCIQILYSFGN